MVAGLFYGLWAYVYLTCGHHTESISKVEFQDRFDILLEMRLSGVAGQGYTMLYGDPS